MTGCPSPSAFCGVTSVHEVAMFVEDYAHRQVVGTLVKRLARERGIEVRLEWHSAVRGYGRVVKAFRRYLRDLALQPGNRPDLIVVATDANCKGQNERQRDFQRSAGHPHVVFAIPDPRVERWLLLDGAAFRNVVGRGCGAPDQKCSRDRYKRLLREAVYKAGVVPTLGGIEFAEDIVQRMNLERAARIDRSLSKFVDGLASEFRRWRL